MRLDRRGSASYRGVEAGRVLSPPFVAARSNSAGCEGYLNELAIFAMLSAHLGSVA
jgi:hypothetical protein